MKKQTQSKKSYFIGKFKLGDNIIHNLDILHVLYRHFNESTNQEKNLLCKPIVILLVSISEAIVHDLHFRIKAFTNEGVQSIPQKVLKSLRSLSTPTKYSKFIQRSNAYELFGTDKILYINLEKLAELRNRVHIQNIYNAKPANEIKAFTVETKELAESTTEWLIAYSSEFYSRNPQKACVGNFNLPWKQIHSLSDLLNHKKFI